MNRSIVQIIAQPARWRRHQLVWLDDEGWQSALAPPPPARRDLQALDCLRHWARHGLPLVVTRQPSTAAAVSAGGGVDPPPALLSVGLAAPARWQRLRLALEVPTSAVRRVGVFPSAAAVSAALPAAVHAAWSRLCAGFDRLAITARVYGSHGWQQISGLDHVHDGSDIDLAVAVAGMAQADAAVALLLRCGFETPRIDGELVFDDGAAVAWREWALWRAGEVDRVLVKRLHGAAIERTGSWGSA